ncbi:MAG: class I SAM-dependent methyltransferase [Myxococcota bacterium]
MDPFFGELYLRSTRPFLHEHVTEAEADFLRARLPRQGLVLDVGCGHGRHLARLGDLALAGVDRDQLSLLEARLKAPVARGDFTALPFRSAAFAGAFAWYNTLGTFEPEVAQAMLKEIARCLAPRGLFVVQGSHRERSVEQPTAWFDGPLPDGAHLREECRYDADGRRDRLTRTLTFPDGRVMAASFFIRYYDVDEWRSLLAEAGLELEWVCGGVDGSPVTASSTDVIAGARKRE